MADSAEVITVKGDGVSVSRLIWRRFHRPMPGLVERVLDTNPGLADQGAFIAPGTRVTIPIPAHREREKVLDPIKLW